MIKGKLQLIPQGIARSLSPTPKPVIPSTHPEPVDSSVPSEGVPRKGAKLTTIPQTSTLTLPLRVTVHDSSLHRIQSIKRGDLAAPRPQPVRVNRRPRHEPTVSVFLFSSLAGPAPPFQPSFDCAVGLGSPLLVQDFTQHAAHRAVKQVSLFTSEMPTFAPEGRLRLNHKTENTNLRLKRGP